MRQREREKGAKGGGGGGRRKTLPYFPQGTLGSAWSKKKFPYWIRIHIQNADPGGLRPERGLFLRFQQSFQKFT